MNSLKPRVLVIASVLKPVDDVRMYKKFAKSLAGTGKYTVHVVGFRAQAPPVDASVSFYPLFDFARLHRRRLLANYFFYRTLRKIVPDLLILTTPELFPAAWWYRRKRRVCLVYDMVENYGRNIRYNRGVASVLIAPLVRALTFVERRLRNASSLLLSAEKGYVSELNLAPSSVLVIENKVLTPLPRPAGKAPRPAPLSVIYTGTVSEVYGIHQALALMQSLTEQTACLTFTVLGHVPQASLHRQLQAYARQHPWLVLRTHDRPVPHDDIIALIQDADFGIVSHQPVPSIAHCFPTRIWEYMAYRLPFLLQDHPYWTEYCRPWECAISLDFNRPPRIEALRQAMTTGSFYPRGVPDTIYWETEAQKLIGALDTLTARR